MMDSDTKLVVILLSGVLLVIAYGFYEAQLPKEYYVKNLVVDKVEFIVHPSHLVNAKYLIISKNGTIWRVWMPEHYIDKIKIGIPLNFTYTKNDLGDWIYEIVEVS